MAPSPLRLATGSYVGDGSDDRAITGVGFRPDVVFIKCGCSQRPVIRTSTMSGDASKPIGLTGALQPDRVQSLDADGFTVGADLQVNNPGQTFYWVAMRAGGDLKAGSYTGDGMDNRSITGVGFQPEWLITLGDGEDSWFRPSALPGDASYSMGGSGTYANRIQATEADGFQVGSNSDVNQASTVYHYIAFNVGPVVAQASYAGSGADNRSISGARFQPQVVWVKRSSTNQSSWRPASTSGDLSLYWSATSSIANRIQALEADGFQVGAADQVNNTSGTYYYLALRDAP